MKRIVCILLLALLTLLPLAGCRSETPAASEPPVPSTEPPASSDTAVYQITVINGEDVGVFLNRMAEYQKKSLEEYLEELGIPDAGSYFLLTLRQDGSAEYSTADLFIRPKQGTGTWKTAKGTLTVKCSALEGAFDYKDGTLTGVFGGVSMKLKKQ